MPHTGFNRRVEREGVWCSNEPADPGGEMREYHTQLNGMIRTVANGGKVTLKLPAANPVENPSKARSQNLGDVALNARRFAGRRLRAVPRSERDSRERRTNVAVGEATESPAGRWLRTRARFGSKVRPGDGRLRRVSEGLRHKPYRSHKADLWRHRSATDLSTPV